MRRRGRALTPKVTHVTIAGAIALCVATVGYSATQVGAKASAEAWGKQSCRDVVSTAKFAGPIGRATPLVKRMKAAFAAPGLQVAVAVDGDVVWSRVCGYADVTRRRPTGPATLFRIGSVSKIFTATALARLVQAGKVDLEAEVQKYVPLFPEERQSAEDRASCVAPVRHSPLRGQRGTEHQALPKRLGQPGCLRPRPAAFSARYRLLLLELWLQPARGLARGRIGSELPARPTADGAGAAWHHAHAA